MLVKVPTVCKDWALRQKDIKVTILAFKEFTVDLEGKTRTQPTEHQSPRLTILREDSKGSWIQ